MDVPRLMDPRSPDRFEELLTRAFDGEISPDERRELDALANVEPRLVALAELRDALRAALAVPGPVDVAGEVMAALAADADWDLGAPLREALGGGVDLADAIFAGIAAEADWAPVGATLKEALRAPEIDVADAVMAEVADTWTLGDTIREAVAGPVDVADAVFAALAEDAAFAPVAAALRDAVRAPVDVADDVMAAVDPDGELSAWLDGELPAERAAVVEARLRDDAAARATVAAFEAVGADLRAATARNGDLWPAVADGIGADPAAVHGWEAIGRPLREALAALPEIDVAGAVMAAVEPARHRMPKWASLAGPIVAFAAAAAVLFAVVLPTTAPGPSTLTSSIRLATVNDAQVEEVTAGEDVVVQVMQFEEGGPTFILVDEPSGSGVPL